MAACSSNSQIIRRHSSTGFIGEQLNGLIRKKPNIFGFEGKIRKLNGDLDRKVFALLDQAFNSDRPLKTFVLRDVLSPHLALIYGSEDVNLYKHRIVQYLKTKDLDSLITLDLSGFNMEEDTAAIGEAIDVIAKCKLLTTLRINRFVAGRPILYSTCITSSGNREYIEKLFNDPRNVYATFEEDPTGQSFTVTTRQPSVPEGHKGNPNLAQLSQALRSLPHLTSLSLQENGIASAEALERLELNRFQSLGHLELNDNYFDDEAFAKIAELFSKNTRIVELDLSWCWVNPDRLSSLGKMLTTNMTLQILRLKKRVDRFKTPQETLGLAPLATALAVNNTLKVLDLDGHNIPVPDYIEFFHNTLRDDSPLDSLGEAIRVSYFGAPGTAAKAEEDALIMEHTRGLKLSALLAARAAERLKKTETLFQKLWKSLGGAL